MGVGQKGRGGLEQLLAAWKTDEGDRDQGFSHGDCEGRSDSAGGLEVGPRRLTSGLDLGREEKKRQARNWLRKRVASLPLLRR